MFSNRNLAAKIKREKHAHTHTHTHTHTHFERPRKASENQGCRKDAAERKGEEL